MPLRTAAAVPTVLSYLLPVFALLSGYWVYMDAKRRGRDEVAPLFGVIVGGLFLTGSVPALVALAVSENPAPQGFPTSLRVIPGFVALVVYVYFR